MGSCSDRAEASAAQASAKCEHDGVPNERASFLFVLPRIDQRQDTDSGTQRYERIDRSIWSGIVHP
jgi:hypothetical protein